MTASDRFERRLQDWLEAEVSTSAPVGLHQAAIERARASRQRPTWLLGLRRGLAWEPLASVHLSKRRAAYLFAILALVLVGLVALVSGAFRSEPIHLGRNGLIAYSVGDAAGLHVGNSILLTQADATAELRIASGTCPVFARNGSVLAYTSTSFDLIVAEVATGGVSSSHSLAGLGKSEYALSPDGTQIAWLQRVQRNDDINRQSELWLRNVAGGPGIRLVPAPADASAFFSSPTWSPNGRQIAFATVTDLGADGSYRSAISVIDADGSNLRLITRRPGSDTDSGMSWSPDGRAIAYTGFLEGSPVTFPGLENPPLDVFVIGLDGSDDRNLTTTAGTEEHPLWSPDGTHLAYLSSSDVIHLTTIRMNGSVAVGQPRLLGPAIDTFSWSPDGSKLLLLREQIIDSQATGGTILTVDAEFRQPPSAVRIVDHPITCPPTWQPLIP